MIRKQPEIKKSTIIIVVIVLSIVLYLAGVLSGLYANKLVEYKTKVDIESLKNETSKNLENIKSETKENVELLKTYVQYLELNLKNIQLDQIFLDTLDDDKKCNFSTITMRNLLDELGFYWQRLPFRIESYEKNNKLSPEYLQLKSQYMQLSIRAWILANNKYEKCNTDLIPILYFYNKNCTTCIEQGEELDKLQVNSIFKNKSFIVFTIDFNSDELIIKNIEEFYGINSTPAIVIDNNVLQGRMFNKTEIETSLLKSKMN